MSLQPRIALACIFVTALAACTDDASPSDTGEGVGGGPAGGSGGVAQGGADNTGGSVASAGGGGANDGGGGTAPSCWYEQNWSYPDTAAMIAANTNTFSLGTVSLETGELHDGTTGPFMRATLRGDGTEDHTNYDLDLPGAGAGVSEELWVEFYLRFNEAWSIVSDDKTFFIFPPDGGGTRWEIHFANGRIWGGPSGSPGDFFVVAEDGAPLSSAAIWDGQWHRNRLYLRINSAQGVADGAFYWWLDDQVLLDASTLDAVRMEDGESFDTGTFDTYFAAVRLGANADPTGSGVRDWGRLCIYNQDPGW